MGKKDKKPKKADKKSKAEKRAGTFAPFEAPGPTVQAEATDSLPILASTEDFIDAANRSKDWAAKQDAEVAAQWAHFKKITAPTEVPDEPEQTKIEATKKAVQKFADALAPGIEKIIDSMSALAGAQVALETDTDHGREFVVGPVPAVSVEAPADPVLVNGNGQAMIHYLDPVTGQEKVKGYTRVTTYIDGLDDKSVLTKWKMRTLLEGGAVEILQNYGDSPSLQAVARSVKRTDEALADIDSREKIDSELLGLRRAEILKEHRTSLERIAEELMELGGAHEKANKGTDLHHLTELVDNGQPLPADTIASDRRDVEAYQAKMTELGITTLWTERRIVLDDIQVSGTMDRAYQIKLPGMQRRIRVVGDLKTGSVSWGQGKIGMQLALYARGLGYDWTKPLERERLSLSRAHGLLVHLPQGEGRCEVYLVDLELAAKGLTLAAEVREWRNAGKRVYDLKKPL